MKPLLEHIEIGKEKSAVAFRYSKRDFETPWHFHPQHELTYIESSRGTKFIGDYVGSYEEGELVLLKAYLPHSWKNYTDDNTLSISTVVQWNKGIVPQLPEMTAIMNMLTTSSRGIIFHKEDIQATLPSILALPGLSGSTLVIQLLDVLERLSTCRYENLSINSYSDNQSSTTEKRMVIIHEYVAEHYNAKIKLNDVAAIVGMSEQSFSRFFNKMMGQSFFTFLAVYRINIACRMLVDTDWPVSQIGFACGYESIPFFYKQFKQLKGTSPLKFRNEGIPKA